LHMWQWVPNTEWQVDGVCEVAKKAYAFWCPQGSRGPGACLCRGTDFLAATAAWENKVDELCLLAPVE
jgi:hypothetical protein